MDFNHLPWQPGAQIACVAVHYPHQAGHVVRKFRPASVSVVVNERKVVFKTDPGADRHGCGQQCRKRLVIAGILVGVIGNKKSPAVEK